MLKNDGSFYKWSTDDISQTIAVEQAGEYWVEVTNQQRCMGRDTILVSFPEGDQFVGLATGFSPNGDGENDILFVRGNNISAMNLIIYNRLGHKIFQSNRQDVGWGRNLPWTKTRYGCLRLFLTSNLLRWYICAKARKCYTIVLI